MNIVITGASKGMGKALAQQNLQTPKITFSFAQETKGLAETANELNENYWKRCYNILRPISAVKTSAEHFIIGCRKGIRPDVLINNAGQFMPGSIYNEEEGMLEKMISV